MTKGELLRLLEPYTDEIVIGTSMFDVSGFVAPVTDAFYCMTKDGEGIFVLDQGKHGEGIPYEEGDCEFPEDACTRLT